MHKRIGIFGGSFDPPHNGHVEICRHILGKNDVDEVWVVPCFKHPFGKKMAPFQDRVAMCKSAFAEFADHVKISEIEKTIGGPSYTIKTIEHARQSCPDCEFYLIVGSDTNCETSQWKDFDKIKTLLKLVVIPRGGGSPIPDVSSTSVREAIRAGREFSGLVPKKVADYIIKRKLYL